MDFGAGKFRNTMYFLDQKKKVTAVEFEDLSKKSKDAKENLEICKKDDNFEHLIFPFPFIENSQTFDLCLLVNVLPVMPVFTERLLVLDLLYGRIKEGKYVLWYAQKEGTSYKNIREKGKNDFGDGIWRGTNKMFKTFYKYHSIDEVKEMFALYGFEFVRRIPAPSNDALLFKKIPYNLFHGILTPKRITDAIPRFENIEKPESVKPKRMKETVEKKAIIPDPYYLSIEKLYVEALRAIPTKEMAEEYHRLVSQMVLRIFRNSLRNMVIKVTMDQGLKIMDTVYSNDGGFFDKVSNTEKINCNYIPLEAKNYSYDLENPQYDQIKGRLDPQVGQLGILVCRKIGDVEKSNQLCQSFLRDKKYIIVLTDKDLIGLLELSSDNNTEEINDFMDAKIRAIKFGST